MSDLLTLPASDLVAHIAALELKVESANHYISRMVKMNKALQESRAQLIIVADALTAQRDAAHNAALEAAAEIADGWSTHVGAAIRGLRR